MDWRLRSAELRPLRYCVAGHRREKDPPDMKTANRASHTAATHRVSVQRKAPLAAQPATATFAVGDTGPIDAPMWPLCAPSWLQPEISPSLPAWTGLAIERH